MSAASERPAPRVGVGAVILDRSEPSDPRVLMIRRANPPLAGAWSLPGGKVRFGESLTSATAREASEETGLDVRVGPLVEVVEIVIESFHYVVLDYLCEPIGGVARAGGDASACAWVSVSSLAELGVTEAVLRVVDRALAMAGERAEAAP